jgi:hypothetical protein
MLVASLGLRVRLFAVTTIRSSSLAKDLMRVGKIWGDICYYGNVMVAARRRDRLTY